MSREKQSAIRIAKQMFYINKEDISRMEKPETTVEDCYRIMKQRRLDCQG